ncbi:hypothetical protein STEG23_028738 [Scotinomys teguina]
MTINSLKSPTEMPSCVKGEHQDSATFKTLYHKKGIFEYLWGPSGKSHSKDCGIFLLTLEDPVKSTDVNRIGELDQSRVTNKKAQG